MGIVRLGHNMGASIKPAPRRVGKFHELTEMQLRKLREHEAKPEWQRWFANARTDEVRAYYSQTRMLEEC